MWGRILVLIALLAAIATIIEVKWGFENFPGCGNSCFQYEE